MNFLPPVIIYGIFWAVLSVIRQSAKTKSKLSGVLALIIMVQPKKWHVFIGIAFVFRYWRR